ncbi:amino acid transporter [Stenotrophomonas maltophilia]|uniref:amino acid transporter n=1 Tax=Stenotrophomonas maltophilia TaxID=40324 RepID=UPI0018D3D200|nr:amino acid transporter [Stenotrophomonas maltophilia]
MDRDSRPDGIDAPGYGDRLVVVALTLLLGGSVVALVGQHTAAQAGPAIVLSLLLAALGMGPLLYCLHVQNQQWPAADGLYGVLRDRLGSVPAVLLGGALLLELVLTTAGVAQSIASHLHALLAGSGIETRNGMPDQLMAAASLLLLAVVGLLRPHRVVRVACVLLTVKIGVGLLLLVLAARHVHYAYWIPWLPPATAPYRFGIGGVLAASVPLSGVFATVGLVLGFPGIGRQARARTPRLLVCVLLAMVLLIVLAALQAGLVEFPSLASTRPLSVALQHHPELYWMMPLLPLAGVAGLVALVLVLLMLAARLAIQLWPTEGDESLEFRERLVPVAVVLSAALLALWAPMGSLPVLPGPATLLVMGAVCLAVLRGQVPRPRALPVLAPVAIALCLLAAVERMRVWPG